MGRDLLCTHPQTGHGEARAQGSPITKSEARERGRAAARPSDLRPRYAISVLHTAQQPCAVIRYLSTAHRPATVCSHTLSQYCTPPRNCVQSYASSVPHTAQM
eukprot:3941201-Rhodomonas_salina.6